jgi:hypothetical protein
MSNFSAISWRETSYIDEMRSLCTRPTCLVGFLLCYLTETTGMNRYMSLHSDTLF